MVEVLQESNDLFRYRKTIVLDKRPNALGFSTPLHKIMNNTVFHDSPCSFPRVPYSFRKREDKKKTCFIFPLNISCHFFKEYDDKLILTLWDDQLTQCTMMAVTFGLYIGLYVSSLHYVQGLSSSLLWTDVTRLVFKSIMPLCFVSLYLIWSHLSSCHWNCPFCIILITL